MYDNSNGRNGHGGGHGAGNRKGAGNGNGASNANRGAPHILGVKGHRGARKPRILLVLTEFPPRIGGMQTHAFYLARHLRRRGYPIEVVTYQPASLEERQAVRDFDHHLGYPVRRVLSRLGYWHNLEHLAAIGHGFNPDLVYSSTVFYGFLRDILDVPVLCRSVGNDVLRPWIAYPFRPGSRALSTPYVDDQLYKFFRRFDYPELLEILFRERRWELMRDSARRMDTVIANSAFTAGLLSEIGVREEALEVLVGGVDAHRFEPPRGFDQRLCRRALGLPEDAFLMTTACRLVAKKGIDFLLPAMTAVRKAIPDAHLLVIGEGRHGKRYRRLAQSTGLDDAVTFAGRVDHQQIHEYYWASDFFVLASRVQIDPTTGLRDAETMGRVLCEANAAGLTTVAARSGGIPSVIRDGENGLLFTSDDEDSLVEQLCRAREDRELTDAMRERGRRIAVEVFDWSVILAAHESYFARALGATAEPPRSNGLLTPPITTRSHPRVRA